MTTAAERLTRGAHRPRGGRDSVRLGRSHHVSTTTVPLDNEADARKVLHLIDLLEDHDDVQNVYANFDIPDAILELVEA